LAALFLTNIPSSLIKIFDCPVTSATEVIACGFAEVLLLMLLLDIKFLCFYYWFLFCTLFEVLRRYKFACKWLKLCYLYTGKTGNSGGSVCAILRVNTTFIGIIVRVCIHVLIVTTQITDSVSLSRNRRCHLTCTSVWFASAGKRCWHGTWLIWRTELAMKMHFILL